MKHILTVLKITAAVVGVGGSDGETKKIEKEENELLKELIKQQKISNAVLLKMLEDQDQEAFDDLMKELR